MVEPVEPVDPLLVLPEEEPVARPWGLDVVGTTEGTEVHALSYATKFVLVCVGMADAATEYSIHSSALFTIPKMKERHDVLASHCA